MGNRMRSGGKSFLYIVRQFHFIYDGKRSMLMRISFVGYRFIHTAADKNPYFDAISPFKVSLNVL